MTDTAKERMQTSIERECRACLAKISDDAFGVDLFRTWDPPWSGMGVSIAEDLAKLTNIQISVSDAYSKTICKKCCSRLQDAISFTWSVQNSDLLLRKSRKDNAIVTLSWPKPIQLDKNITTQGLFNEMQVEVKQEVMSEDEYEINNSELMDQRLDIKIEPEEITPVPQSIVIEVNGPFSLSRSAEATLETNGDTEHLAESHEVKEEPMSDDESDIIPGMPKDCMLCMKAFNTLKGLKAHVIAVHSYDSFTSRRVDRKNVCSTCNRSFATRTDLFVHETCHSKFACYVCDQKFDTFLLLTKHRSKQCMKTSVLPRLKTLDDVRRPVYYIADKNESPSVNSQPTTSNSNSVSPEKPASPVSQYTIKPDPGKTNSDIQELLSECSNVQPKEHLSALTLCNKKSNSGALRMLITESIEKISSTEESSCDVKIVESDISKLSEIMTQKSNEYVEVLPNENGSENFSNTENYPRIKQESLDTTYANKDTVSVTIIMRQQQKTLDTQINKETTEPKSKREIKENISDVDDKTEESEVCKYYETENNTAKVNGKTEKSEASLNTKGKTTEVYNKTTKSEDLTETKENTNTVDNKINSEKTEASLDAKINTTEVEYKTYAIEILDNKTTRYRTEKSEIINKTTENNNEVDKIEKTEVINKTIENPMEYDGKTVENISDVHKPSDICSKITNENDIQHTIASNTTTMQCNAQCTSANDDALEPERKLREQYIKSLKQLETGANESISEQTHIKEHTEINLTTENSVQLLPIEQLGTLEAQNEPIKENMEIQLEIHSMHKREDKPMDIDYNLKIEMDSLESDKHA